MGEHRSPEDVLAENRRLRAALVKAHEQSARLIARVAELEGPAALEAFGIHVVRDQRCRACSAVYLTGTGDESCCPECGCRITHVHQRRPRGAPPREGA